MRRTIATGRVFQRSYRDPKTGELKYTSTWFLKYYIRGKPVTVASGTEDKEEAIALLRRRVAGIDRQEDLAAHPERVRMNQLFSLLIENYRLKERATTYDVEKRVAARLGKYFGKMKAQAVTPSVLRRYIDSRKRAKPAPENATINKELAYVRRAMNPSVPRRTRR